MANNKELQSTRPHILANIELSMSAGPHYGATTSRWLWMSSLCSYNLQGSRHLTPHDGVTAYKEEPDAP